MDDIDIRLAREEDAIALSRLITELGYPTKPEDMAARMQAIRGRGDMATLVAVAAGAVVGMVGVSASPSFVRDRPHGQIIAFVVAEAHRGRGVGKALIARAEAWFAEKGVQRIVVTSGSHRHDAHAFYRSCGYQQTGLRYVRML